MSAADSYSLDQSLAPDDEDFIAQNRQFTWINDSNSSAYQSQVVWDLAGISNSGKYLDCKQSYLVVPLVMTLASTAGQINNATLENAYACSLKNSYSSLIHSMQIECTNNSVVSTMSFSGAYINFKLLSSMGAEDAINFAPSIGFAKDDTLSIGYQGAASAQGLGETNNQITPSLFNPTSGYGKSAYAQNTGRLKRMEQTSYDPAATGVSTASLSAQGKNFCQKDALGQNGQVVNWNILANVPLTVLSDFFAQFPLCKGMYLRITLNLNVNCTTQMTVNTGGQFTSVSTSSQNGVVPYMISPLGAGQGLNIGGTTPSTGLQLSIAIAGNTYVNPSLTSCRFYGCMYDLAPATEQMYLSKSPTKVIEYEDFLSFQTLNVPAGGNFSQVLTNSIARGRRLVCIPVISGTANYAGAAGFISPMASPFSSSPATTSSCPITNYNVLVSGSNLYQQNYNYSWEQFLQETRKTNAINGGSALGLSSGLISQTDFETGYRYLVSNLSRTSGEASDNVSKSIQVIGTNSGAVAIDLYWYLVYERSVEIDIASGSLVA